MKIALIGCGFIADTHAKVLKGMGEEIVMAIGTSAQRTAAFAEKWHIPQSFTDWHQALREDVDCIHITTPPTLHYEMSKAALLAGKHVICEKPLCLSPQEGKELADLVREKQLFCAVNYNVRFNDACLRAKKLVSGEKFGSPFLISGSYLQEFHILPAAWSWRYQPKIAGKMRAVTEIGSHWIDLLHFITGLKITETAANLNCFQPQRWVKDGLMYAAPQEGAREIRVDSDDSAEIMLRFSNGAAGSLFLSEISHGRSNELKFEITGSGQSVFWNSEDPYRLNIGECGKGVRSEVNAFTGGFPDSFSAFFEAAYQAMREDASNSLCADFDDGSYCIAVCEAIYQSAQNNGVWTAVS